MNKSATNKSLAILGSSALIVAVVIFYLSYNGNQSTGVVSQKEISEKISAQDNLDRVEMKLARSEYFFQLMRDPETNQIPENIRNRELDYAKTLPTARQAFAKAKSANPSLKAADYDWEQAGPFDVGGRTRALAVDQRNADIVLAGGVSGGMWKSTDGGDTWNLQTPDLPNLSVTSVAQDPLNPDTWYYSSGEVLGNSAGASGAAYYGDGIYKSTDNGNTWTLMPQASTDGTSPGLVSPYNTVSRVRVSPTTGTIFLASTGFGIYRSTDGQSFSDTPVLGTRAEQLFTDVAIASDGVVGAAISEASFDDQGSSDPGNSHDPGIFISENDGQAWIEVTPSDFPDTYRRSVITFAPSNPDIMYVFTLKGVGQTSNQNVAFFKIDITDPQNPSTENRSDNLPDFRENGGGTGYVNLQGGYNMVVDVKPDDEDYVFIGGTNLFRSDDGFATSPTGGYDGSNESQKDQYWIGGYAQNNGAGLYPNQHPDQHILVFPEPNSNPNLMLSGHDGGLSLTSDVTASEVSWVDKDDGYITSQFYAADIPADEGDNRLVGGTQDNGSPFFEQGQQGTQSSTDISSGDGAYADFTDNYLFVSSQVGRILRWSEDFSELSYVYPALASDQLFIHPYAVDPNDENVMYYPENNHIWRNTILNSIQSGNSSSGSTTGWEELQNIDVGPNHTITALEVSQNPGDILYFAGSQSSQRPIIKRLTGARSASSGAEDISIPGSPSGAYVKDIAINPVNANEAIVVMTNYNIVGLYHTSDGGESWSAIEGNLQGNAQNPGPSLRSATMIPSDNGIIYFVGTSTGLYSTQALDGSNTTWGQEATGILGNVVTEHLSSRISDGDIVAASHGRGIFYGDFNGSTSARFITASPFEGRPGQTLTLEANDFDFNTSASANTVTFRNTTEGSEAVNADVVNISPSELEVEIPRGVGESGSVFVNVESGNVSLSTPFQLLPPNDFTIKQNFPNPFNPTTTIPFDIPTDAEVTLSIYNINGQKVREPISEENFSSGTYNQSVDFTGLASGIYIYRLISESNGQTLMKSRKLTYIK
jgi:photosystem II stability/assembly factor-like uncharacterized protein